MKFKSIIFWFKNKVFRSESQKAYIQALLYETIKTEDKVNADFMKRRQLLEYAYNNCPFYKKLYDQCGFHPSQLITHNDWQKVPIIEKKMIRENADSFISIEFDKTQLSSITTGGSTGKPLKVYKSKHVHYEVLGWRALKWYGISPSDNEAIMHRKVPVTFRQKIINRMMWWPTRRAYLSATAISDSDIEIFLKEVQVNKIKWIVGYCASIEYVADYILRKNIIINGIKLIWSTSSPLTQIVRQKIENAFRCKVMDQYGCCEMGNIAIQKPEEDFLTINSDYVHVDIVDENNKLVTDEKKYGDILITDLNTKEFPLIKYRLGDRSRIILSMQESNDGFPKLEFVKGRISDAIWLPNGTYVDGSFLTTICDNYSEAIACYQIHQKNDFSIDISFVLKSGVDKNDIRINHIVNDLKQLTQNNVDIIHQIVSTIPDFAGKRKFIISDISLSKI